MPRVLHNTRHARLRACAVLLASVLLPGLASCGDDVAPILNPAPKHVVKISGRMPASLDVRLVAKYSIHSKACEPDPMPPWPLGAAMMQKYFKRVDLQITRTGDRYETSFAVDRYLPGKCDWRFTGVGYSVVRNGNEADIDIGNRSLISGITFYDPTFENNCDGIDKTTCAQESNSSEAPVIVPCVMYVRSISLPPPAKQGTKTPSLFCDASSHIANPYKKKHLLRQANEQVIIDFYDLETDPDPTAR